jgi:GNAT superfamily N-acetyltransferase
VSINISRAGLDRLKEAWEIVSDYYDAIDVVEREDQDAFSRVYFGEGAGVWLAETDAATIGCIALKQLAAIPRSGEVKRLYVRPEWRGHGVAGALLDALHDYAREYGYEWLYLDTKDDLDTAIRFYRNRGYVDCPRYNENPQATIFMRRRM